MNEHTIEVLKKALDHTYGDKMRIEDLRAEAVAKVESLDEDWKTLDERGTAILKDLWEAGSGHIAYSDYCIEIENAKEAAKNTFGPKEHIS